MGDSMHKREENSVRVTNLSEDTREDDLRVGPVFVARTHVNARCMPAFLPHCFLRLGLLLSCRLCSLQQLLLWHIVAAFI